jgi:hypothetical protein
VITIHINPQAIDNEYLRCLNACYNPWGDLRQYDWYFRRSTSYPSADVIVLRIDGHLAAGSAVSYRRLALANNNEVIVGIITGAWTLPDFRNHGCFARLIKESVHLTKEKRGALLLGFVREENASSRQLARLGSAMFPSSYLVSTGEKTIDNAFNFKRLDLTEHVATDILRKLKNKGRGLCRFTYATESDFLSQLVYRPADTELLSDGNGNFGIIETRRTVDVLQLAIIDGDEHDLARAMAGFANYAHEKGRQLSAYSTTSITTAAALWAGFQATEGYLTALIGDATSLNEGLQLSNGLTAGDSSLLADQNSAGFLGHWFVQSGDRL